MAFLIVVISAKELFRLGTISEGDLTPPPKVEGVVLSNSSIMAKNSSKDASGAALGVLLPLVCRGDVLPMLLERAWSWRIM